MVIDVNLGKVLDNPSDPHSFKELKESPIRTISSNFEDFLVQAKFHIKELDISISSLCNLKEIEKHCSILRRSVAQLTMNLCFSIESVTNLFASLSHPLTKYDLSEYYLVKDLDKQIDKILYSKRTYDGFEYKVAMLFGTYFNSLKYCDHSNLFPFTVRSEKPIPIFSKDNLEILLNSDDISISKKNFDLRFNELSIKEHLKFIELIFDLRNITVHSSPKKIFDSLKYTQALASGTKRSFSENMKVFIPFITSQDLSIYFLEKSDLSDLISCSKIILDRISDYYDHIEFILSFLVGVTPVFYNGIKYSLDPSGKFIYKFEQKKINHKKPLCFKDYCKKIIEYEFGFELPKNDKDWPDISFLAYSNHIQSN